MSASGRIAAILELGMGFNPDLTGRENVAHSAGLMGFSRAQIDSLMPDIEAFAEVVKYFDEPLRTYSSGMQMRVAFSLATASRRMFSSSMKRFPWEMRTSYTSASSAFDSFAMKARRC